MACCGERPDSHSMRHTSTLVQGDAMKWARVECELSLEQLTLHVAA
jgi:hypothetical protein